MNRIECLRNARECGEEFEKNDKLWDRLVDEAAEEQQDRILDGDFAEIDYVAADEAYDRARRAARQMVDYLMAAAAYGGDDLLSGRLSVDDLFV